MKSYTTARFRKIYETLPQSIREQARKAYKQFKDDPFYPSSLHFRRVHPKKSVYSARINDDYRVVGLKEGDTIVWFWIGSHTEYDKLHSQF